MIHMIMDAKGNTFYVEFDKDDLIKQAEALKGEFIPFHFSSCGDLPKWGVPYMSRFSPPRKQKLTMTEEEYVRAIEKFIEKIKAIDKSRLTHMINDWPRNLDGSLREKRVERLFQCKATECVREPYWLVRIYKDVVIKSENEYTLSISIREYIQHPG